MAWHPILVDRQGRHRALLQEHGGFTVTRRLNGWTGFKTDIDAEGRAAPELGVGDRCVKLYNDGTLRFHGDVWEPLVLTPGRVTLEARGPLARLPWRRVRVETTYTAEDAGAIAHDRLDVQNAYAPTGLVPGDVDVSLDRDRTYLPGKREDELLDQLAGVQGAFFYVETPVDGTPGVRAQLDIRYPDAGTTRPEARFEYGAGTLANLEDYEVTRGLPLNRVVGSSSDVTGGRMAVAAENTPSISRYGLFEDEVTVNDVTESDTLLEHAEGNVRTVPSLTIGMTPGPDAPLLFTDFDVGDFVRVRIRHASLDLHVWARVLEATLHVDAEGVERLESLVVETLTGARPTDLPHLIFRQRMEAERGRLEALERRVMNMEQTPVASPAEPTPGESGDDPPDEGETPGSGTPAAPAAPSTPPPPAPASPPTLSGLSGESNGPGTIAATVTVNGNGSATTVWFEVVAVQFTAGQAIGTGGATVTHSVSGLAAGNYSVKAHAQNAAGAVYSGPIVVTVLPSELY